MNIVTRPEIKSTYFIVMNTSCYRIFVAGTVVVLFLTQSVTSQVCSCPLGWRTKQGNSHCYFSSAEHGDVATFTRAQAKCRPKSGSLIILNNEDEFNFFEFLRNNTSFWIGAKWDESRRKMVWLNGEDIGDWAQYHWGQLSVNISRHYAFVTEHGVWVDREEKEEHHYICEKEGRCPPTSTMTFQAATPGTIDQNMTSYIMTVEENVGTSNSSILSPAADGVSTFLGVGLGAGGGLLSVLGCVFVLIVMKTRAVQRGRNKRKHSEITTVPADEENLTAVGMNEYEAIHDNEYASVDDGIVPFSNTANAIGTRGMQASRKEAALQSGDEDKEQLYAMPDSNHRARERGNGHIDDEAGTELVENDVYGD